VATALIDAKHLAAADVVHQRFSALDAAATVGEVRAWFAESAHRRMAFLADADGRYAGSLTRADVDEGDPDRPAAEVAHPGPTIAPDAPAADGYELAITTDARRVPVVDAGGRLVGVLAVTEDLAGFCGSVSRG
jgi:CBS domain-containing protein